MICRYPTTGDENKFLDFLDSINSEFFDITKLKNPQFISGMINITSKDKGVCLFAEEAVRIIGFCNVIQESGLWNVGIAVSKLERRKGVASNLMDDCLLLAKKIGIQKVNANTKKDNIPMQTMLIKQGFQKTGENKDKMFFEKRL